MKVIIQKYYILFIAVILIIGCESFDSKMDPLWANTQIINLTQETTTLKIPKSFKRSSKYRIKEDIPLLSLDTTLLREIENRITEYEFRDKDIDVFVDTTQAFRYFIIVDTWLIDFNKFTGKAVNKVMESKCKELEENLFWSKVKKIESKMKQNAKLKILKFKLETENQLSGVKTYQTYFFITSKYRSLIINEVSLDLDDIESYLWTINK